MTIATWPGTQRYDYIRKLGAGAFGVVYEAYDRQRAHRVALKTLKEGGPDELYVLKREFRILSDFTHPNLVELYDLGSVGDRCYYTMELVHGVDFVTYCSGEDAPHEDGWRFDEARLRDTFAQLVRGVQALHDAGKIHRDIKPSNVLVTEEGRVVLLDFGLVSDMARGDIETLTAEILGTPAYMAPEQSDRERELTPAADWYSVGVLLHNALTGRVPFSGAAFDLLLLKRSQPPVTRIQSDVPLPGDLEALCKALLSPDPAARPQASQILAQLEAARPKTRTLPSRSRSRRSQPAFVGRRGELEQLEASFVDVLQGHARTVVIQGESGIGKSALVTELIEHLQHAHPDLVVLRGRCYERETIPYKAIDGLIDNLSGYWRRAPRSQAMYLLPREPELLLRLFPVLGRVPEIANAARTEEVGEPEELRSRAFAALRETFQRLARRAPVVLFVDDLQWADADTIALLSALMQPPYAPRLLFILAARHDEGGALGALAHALPQELTRIELGPLDADEARALAARLGVPEDHTYARQVVQEADGNPFFVQALARYAQESDAPLPKLGLRQALQAQLIELPPQGRSLLELLALAGEPVSQAVIADALQLPPQQITRLTQQLVVQQLARAPSGSGHGLVEPYHDRIREAVREGLGAEACRALHAGLAAALEHHEPAAHERCFRHWLGAGEPGKAAGHALAAAEVADRELSFERAAGYYRSCLEIGVPGREAELRARLADALRHAGRSLEAAEAYTRAAEVAAAPLAIELRRKASAELMRCGRVEQGLAELRSVVDAVGLAFPRSKRQALAAIVVGRARLRLRGFAYEERPADRVAPELLTRIDICFSVSTMIAFADPLVVYGFQTKQLLLALEAGEPYRVARALAAEAVNLAVDGGRKAARADALLEQARALAERAPEPHGRGFVAVMGGTIGYLRGRWRLSQQRSDQAAVLLREQCTGVAWELNTALMYSTLSLFQLGELRELARRLPHHLREAEERRDVYASTILCAGPANACWLAADDPGEARKRVEAVMPVWGDARFYVPHLWALITQVHIDLYEGAPEQAVERLRAQEAQLQSSFPMRIQVGRVRLVYVRGCAWIAACRRGEERDLLERAKQAARQLEGESASWIQSLATLLWAGIAVVQGHDAHAVTLLQSACRQLELAEMWLHAQAARRCQGALRGGDNGRALVREADRWMREQGIRKPERMSAVLVPTPRG